MIFLNLLSSFYCILTAKVQAETSYTCTEWTSWLDRDDPSYSADFELYYAWFEHDDEGYPCGTEDGAFDVECRDKATGTDFADYDFDDRIQFATCEANQSPNDGFHCRNGQSNDGSCPDFEVRFCCQQREDMDAEPEEELETPYTCTRWTSWLDRDDPSHSVDFEVYYAWFEQDDEGYPCGTPDGAFDVECRDKDTGTDFADYEFDDRIQFATCEANQSPNDGFHCKNGQYNDGSCPDFEVRFCCEQKPTNELECDDWTRWYDRDNPSGNNDYEVASAHYSDSGVWPCGSDTGVVGVECRDRSTQTDFYDYDFDSRIQSLWCEATGRPRDGFNCKNGAPSDGSCPDFEVRFCCGLEGDPITCEGGKECNWRREGVGCMSCRPFYDRVLDDETGLYECERNDDPTQAEINYACGGGCPSDNCLEEDDFYCEELKGWGCKKCQEGYWRKNNDHLCVPCRLIPNCQHCNADAKEWGGCDICEAGYKIKWDVTLGYKRCEPIE